MERPEAAVLALTSECRVLRRSLSPLAWTVLEEVVLDAVVEAGRIVAATSTRQVAARLGIDAGTAARALRVLRARDLLALERAAGPAGRFGLAHYVVEAPGLSLLPPCGHQPHMEKPHARSRYSDDQEPVGVPRIVSEPERRQQVPAGQGALDLRLEGDG